MRFALMVACVLLVLSGCVTAPNAEPVLIPRPDPSWVFVEFPASDFEAFRDPPETLQYWAGWIEGVQNALCPAPVASAVLDHSLGILIRNIVNSCLSDNVSASSLAERAVQEGEWHVVDEWQGRAETAHAESIAALSGLRLRSTADVEVAALLMAEAFGNAELMDVALRLRAELAEAPDVEDVATLLVHYQAINQSAAVLSTMSLLFPLPGEMCATPSTDVLSGARAGLTALLTQFAADPEANRTGVYGALGGYLQFRLDRAEALDWWPYALDILSRLPFYEAHLRAASTELPSFGEAMDLWWDAVDATPRSIWRDHYLEVIRPQEPPEGYPILRGQALSAVAAGSLDSGWRFDEARC